VKNIFIGLLAGLLVGGVVTWTYLRSPEPKEEKKEEHKEESRVQHGTNGETFLKLDQETQTRAGLKTVELQPAQLMPEVKGYGRVLDPAPIAALMTEYNAAQAALEVSRQEYERVKKLNALDQNVSLRTLQTAEATARHDQILADAAAQKLMAVLGPGVLGRKDQTAFLESLANLKDYVVRIDLPATESLKEPPTAARIGSLQSGEGLIEAQFLGKATTVDTQMQGQSFLFLTKAAFSLAPGAFVTGYLQVPGEKSDGVVVPRTALLRHEGETFVYVQTGENLFERKEIELEHPVGEGWFVREVLKPKDKIVTAGAQQLLSEELKGAGAE